MNFGHETAKKMKCLRGEEPMVKINEICLEKKFILHKYNNSFTFLWLKAFLFSACNSKRYYEKVIS